MLLTFQFQQLTLVEKVIYIQQHGQFMQSSVNSQKKISSYLMDSYIAIIIYDTATNTVENVLIKENFSDN